jgi:hypothetical protein
MKNLILSTLTILALFAVMAQGYSSGTPLTGRGKGAILALNPGPTGIEIVATGSGEATHLGRYTRTERLTLNPSAGTIAGTIVFTSANGDELWCDVSGGFTGPNTLSGTYTFTGGTGRFANADGEADFNVTQSDPINFTVSFQGTIDLK